jgi:hypothetical protein
VDFYNNKTYDERQLTPVEESDGAVTNRYSANQCLSQRSGGMKKPINYLLNEKSYQTSKIVECSRTGVLS